jgi:hypothetical protein
MADPLTEEHHDSAPRRQEQILIYVDIHKHLEISRLYFHETPSLRC